MHDEIVIDFCDEDRGLLLHVKEIFERDNFKANINVGKNYFELEELQI